MIGVLIRSLRLARRQMTAPAEQPNATPMTQDPSLIEGPNGTIAYRRDEGDGPTGVWLGGYASDMLGTKAQVLSQAAKDEGRGFLRFDYTGHGESAGAFEDGTVSTWLADADHAIETLVDGPRVLIGSSMGAWVTLHLALRHPEKVAGIVLIAPAPDFTKRLVYPRFTDEQKAELDTKGIVKTGDSGHPAETYTKALIEDGDSILLMDKPIELPCPVRILHGMADDVVPTSHVLELSDLIACPSLTLTLVKGGDHRLSEPADLIRLTDTVRELSA